jgi:hypothetical protein
MKTDERNKFAIKSVLGRIPGLEERIRTTNWPQWILSVRGWSSKEPICGF